jgi:hypothetical protein
MYYDDGRLTNFRPSVLLTPQYLTVGVHSIAEAMIWVLQHAEDARTISLTLSWAVKEACVLTVPLPTLGKSRHDCSCETYLKHVYHAANPSLCLHFSQAQLPVSMLCLMFCLILPVQKW